MPLVALIPVIGLVIGDALSATGAVINCYVLHKCGRSLSGVESTDILSRVNTNVAGWGRSNVGPCGVPKYNFDMCKKDLKHRTIHTSIPHKGEARFDNVPPTCMVLAGVLTGECGHKGPKVYPCGNACLHYTGLTEAELGHLSRTLAKHVH